MVAPDAAPPCCPHSKSHSTCCRFSARCFGKMHLAYLPKSRAIGLSKIPRIVDRSRGRKSQERPTQAVAQTIHQIIDPVGG